MVLKLMKILRNNWKKTIFFTVTTGYGINFGNQKYRESIIRTNYCKIAKSYGDKSLPFSQQPRKILVVLNPAARNGKAKKLFEKNAAPILHLAGLEVTLLKTEYEGQAKSYMSTVDKTDAIVVAGGNGTLQEVVTGLLRRPDKDKMCKIPIGFIPIGNTNTLSMNLFKRDDTEMRLILSSAMSVVYGLTKPVDVMSITGDGEKKVFALSDLEWGAFREAENNAKKYWLFGPLKHRVSYVMSTLRHWPRCVTGQLVYESPCKGCSTCYTPPPKRTWRWWHLFLGAEQIQETEDFSQLKNEQCGVKQQETVNTLQFSVTTQNRPNNDLGHLTCTLEPETLDKTAFIKEGWKRIHEGNTSELNQAEKILLQTFTLTPQEIGEKKEWLFIDKEPFELMSIKVELLKKGLNFFFQPLDFLDLPH